MHEAGRALHPALGSPRPPGTMIPALAADVAMDNGVHINPLLRQVYGERSSEAQGQEREE